MLVTLISASALLANVVGVFAQEKISKTESRFVTVDVPQGQVARGGYVQGDNTFVFLSSEMSIDGKLVKGAPYSAQAINESVQTLPGGNRIVRQDTSSVYRDSEGRTRRDQTISMVGGYSAAGGPAQTTFINDPVAGVNYILDAKNRTARKIDYSAKIAAEKRMLETMRAKRTAEGGAPGDENATATAERRAKRSADAGDEKGVAEKIAVEKAAAAGEFRFEMRTGGPGPGPVVAGGGPGGPGFVMMMGNKKNTRKEELGKQTIEGVEAEGTRYVTTIPAGEIGNEQPIEMVFESWYSPELQTVIMTRHSDPRSGENTYRLTNINRSEPAHSLFEVPADYTIQEGGPSPEMRYKIERDGARRPGSN
jgi:nucleoid-associated protein YgaU